MNKLQLYFYSFLFRNLSLNKIILSPIVSKSSNIPGNKNIPEAGKLKIVPKDVKPRNIREENFICNQELEIMEHLKKQEPHHQQRLDMEKCLANKSYRGHYGRLSKDARQEAYFYNDILECLKVLKTKNKSKPDAEDK